MMTSIIEGKKICFRYHNQSKLILDHVDFQIRQNHCTLFLGKSGSGKTTLLKCIAHILDSYFGGLTYHQKPIKEMSLLERVKAIGFVAQQFNLFPHMTALENCVHPQVMVLKQDKKDATLLALELFHHLGMHGTENQKPKELSGGQQQRVAIIRALCMKPNALLLDEPTSALDPANTKQLIHTIKTLQKDGVTICISTHDRLFAKELSADIYFMQEGKVLEQFQEGQSEPMGPFLKQFFDLS